MLTRNKEHKTTNNGCDLHRLDDNCMRSFVAIQSSWALLGQGEFGGCCGAANHGLSQNFTSKVQRDWRGFDMCASMAYRGWSVQRNFVPPLCTLAKEMGSNDDNFSLTGCGKTRVQVVDCKCRHERLEDFVSTSWSVEVSPSFLIRSLFQRGGR